MAFVLTCLLASSLHAEEPTELLALRIKWKNARAQSVAKLEEAYTKNLERKLAALTKAERFTEAVGIRDELVKWKNGGDSVKQDPDKLIILSATYGSRSKVIDVTKKVQGLVKGNHLDFTVGTKALGNPDPQNNTWLVLSYRYGTHRIRATAKISGEAISISQK